MITTLLDLVNPSVFKWFDIDVINAAVDAIKQLNLNDQFDIVFYNIVHSPDHSDTAIFITHIHKIVDTYGSAYIGNVRFSVDEQLLIFEAKAGCHLECRNTIKEP